MTQQQVDQQQVPKVSRRRKWPLVLLCAASIVVALLMAEGFVRLFFKEEVEVQQIMALAKDLSQPSANPELIYENRRNFEGQNKWYRVVTDADGARISPFQQAPAKPEIRIALMGDSSSFGWWVKYEQTYGALLCDMLEQRTGKSIHLRNFSVPGYNSHHTRVALRDRALPWNPDLIILHYDHNDADPINDRPDWLMPPEYGDNPLNSALFKLVARRLQQARNRRFITAASDDPVNPEQIYRGYRYAGPQFDRHLKELEEMVALAEARNIPIVAFLFNTWLERHDDPNEDPFYTLLHQPLSNQLQTMGFEVVDNYARSQQVMVENDWNDLSRTWLAPNDGHPNHRAHQYLAQLLYDELVTRPPTVKLFAALGSSANSDSTDSAPAD